MMRLVAIFIASHAWISFAAAESFAPDRETFFRRCSIIQTYGQRDQVAYPASKKPLTSDHREAIEGIFDQWAIDGTRDKRHLAYMIATAYRETDGSLKPVREAYRYCAEGDEECRERKIGDALLRSARKHNRPPRANYAKATPTGQRYYGRGYVQLTFQKNYQTLGDAVGLGDQLVNDPDKALDVAVARRILIIGMRDGKFTGARLSRYINKKMEDWDEARRVVSPRSEHRYITGALGRYFNSCLQAPG